MTGFAKLFRREMRFGEMTIFLLFTDFESRVVVFRHMQQNLNVVVNREFCCTANFAVLRIAPRGMAAHQGWANSNQIKSTQQQYVFKSNQIIVFFGIVKSNQIMR